MPAVRIGWIVAACTVSLIKPVQGQTVVTLDVPVNLTLVSPDIDKVGLVLHWW